MQIRLRKGSLADQKADLIAVGVFQEGKRVAKESLSVLPKPLAEEIRLFLEREKFEPSLGSSFFVRSVSGEPGHSILVVGLGKKQEEIGEETVRQFAAVAVNVAKQTHTKKIVVAVDPSWVDGAEKACLCGKALAEGAHLAAYEFAKYKSETKSGTVEAMDLFSENLKQARALEDGVKIGTWYARATAEARDLVNEPAKHLRPSDLVKAARKIGTASKGKISIRVFTETQLEKMGAGGLLGVSRGSDEDAFLVHLVYKPLKAKQRIALVGKAVTFDSGGMSLKPADAMMTMKCDMSGAAAVLGAFSVLCELRPNVEVHGIFGACENLPSGKAIVPGDVLRALNGKTIEVLNTDAEGRLTLADTLTYASRQKPDVLIDLATLTGACIVALGEEVAGVMSDDSNLSDRLLACAGKAGEKMWRLPLESSYAKLLKSEVADLKNITGTSRYGGALTAGLFLKEFVPEGLSWAHIDIAGPAFAEKPLNPYTKHGGTGFGVRTLLEYLRSVK
ncbi:MAG TPA: leucyl aminopeptidase [Patescibacteria group bacterium]|nr:leucyl aminopeptidase [Patescibacteria group bacterium]